MNLALQPSPDAGGENDGPERVGTGVSPAWIDLDCPRCRGVLTLEQRHLGVPGFCVWCRLSLVAESDPIGRARVFVREESGAEGAPDGAGAISEENADAAENPDSAFEGPAPSAPTLAADPASAPALTLVSLDSPDSDPPSWPGSPADLAWDWAPRFFPPNDAPAEQTDAALVALEKNTPENPEVPKPVFPPDGETLVYSFLPADPETPPFPSDPPASRGEVPSSRSRSLLVLGVIITGLLSGSALATYFLPTGRYVDAARSYLHARISPQSGEPESLRELVGKMAAPAPARR